VDVTVRPIAIGSAAAIDLGRAAGLEEAEGDTDGMVVRWGAFEGSRLVGTIGLRRWRGLYIIAWMVVAEDRRGLGLGSRLLARAEREALDKGADRIWVLARAPGFYVGAGYVPVDAGPECAMLFTSCDGCEQLGVTCHPRVAAKDLAPT